MGRDSYWGGVCVYVNHDIADIDFRKPKWLVIGIYKSLCYNEDTFDVF